MTQKTLRAPPRSVPRPSVSVLNVSQTESQDYIDVFRRPSGRCTVLYSRTEQTSKPLLLLLHIIVYLQGAEIDKYVQIGSTSDV